MTIPITTRVTENTYAIIESLAKEHDIRNSDIMRGIIHEGARALERGSASTKAKKYYEAIKQEASIRLLKARTNIVRSNAFFVSRAAKMLFEIGRIDQEMREELHDLFLEEAEVRGVRDLYISRIAAALETAAQQDQARKDAQTVVRVE